MGARRSWVVMVDDTNNLQSDDYFSGKVNPISKNNEILSVFFRESHAHSYAQHIASKYPGKDVHIYVQSMCYSTQPKPVETKQWTPDGQLIPLK